jgi:transcriptional regulator with XRE-family HTH domain
VHVSGDFGKELRRRRERSGVSIRRLAAKAKLSDAGWRRLETGGGTRKSTVIAIAAALDWKESDALTLAGFDPDTVTEEDRKSAGEEFPYQMWNQLNAIQRDVLLGVMKVMLNPQKDIFDEGSDDEPPAADVFEYNVNSDRVEEPCPNRVESRR